jgi:hypothetical protein
MQENLSKMDDDKEKEELAKSELSDLQQEYDAPYEVKLMELEEEKYLADLSENSISFIEEKIKLYRTRLDSEENLRKYAKNEHENKHFKAKVNVLIATILTVIEFSLYTGGHLYRYTTLDSIGSLSSIGALLIYPCFFLFPLFVIACIVNAIKLEKESKIILDSYSSKYKKWDYIIAESRERSRIYEKEVKRLEDLVEHMKCERDKTVKEKYSYKKDL